MKYNINKILNLKKYDWVFLSTLLFIAINFRFVAQINASNNIIDQYSLVNRISSRIVLVGSGSYYYTAVIGIKTEKGLIAIDSGISPKMTAGYRKIIEGEFKRDDFIYLINTHSHYDHTTGNQVFSDVPIIAHDNCKTDIEAFWNDTERVNLSIYKAEERLQKRQSACEPGSDMWKFYESMKQQNSTLMESLKDDLKLTYPTVTFSDRMDLFLGDMTLQLIYFGEAHTKSDILIYIPEEKMLFVGDLFDKGGEPDFDITSKKKRWLEVLDWLSQQEIEKIIYGHGLVFTKEDLSLFIKKLRQIK